MTFVHFLRDLLDVQHHGFLPPFAVPAHAVRTGHDGSSCTHGNDGQEREDDLFDVKRIQINHIGVQHAIDRDDLERKHSENSENSENRESRENRENREGHQYIRPCKYPCI